MIKQSCCVLLLWFFLISLVQSGITSTTNVTQVSGLCSGAPYSKLNLCNISCLTCQSSDYKVCSSCSTNFTLSQTDCLLSNDTDTYIYLTYFTGTTIQNQEISLWENANTDKKVTKPDIVHLCSPNSDYQFEMMGLYDNNQEILYSVQFTDEISYITVKLNLLLLSSSATFYVKLGQQIVYSEDFTSLSDLNATYYNSVENNSTDYLSVTSLTTSNAISVIHQIQFNLEVSVTDVSLYLNALSQTTSKYWAFTDFTILSKECNTCPKTELKEDISIISRVLSYTAAGLVPTFIIFFIMLKIKQYRRTLYKQNRRGGKSLPIKAINRMQQRIAQLFQVGKKRHKNSVTDNRKHKTPAEELDILKSQNLKLSQLADLRQTKHA